MGKRKPLVVDEVPTALRDAIDWNEYKWEQRPSDPTRSRMLIVRVCLECGDRKWRSDGKSTKRPAGPIVPAKLSILC